MQKHRKKGGEMILENKKFLKTADVMTNDEIKFLNEGEWVENKKFTYPDGSPKQDFVIKVLYGSDEKDMRLNKTNREALIKAYGKDTANWVGKTAKIVKVKAMVSGKLMDTIVLEV